MSGAGEPDELTAQRAGIHHAQIADERDEPARALIRARGQIAGAAASIVATAAGAPWSDTERCRGWHSCRDTRGSPSCPGVPPEQAIEEIGRMPEGHFGGGW